jgi:hypothetical protein
VSALSEWAAELSAAAARIEDGLAVTVVREQARDFLAIERIITPKRSGKLADSETIDAVTGGGTQAVAIVSPHIIYAQFRNDGGTITRKKRRPAVLGSYGGPYFGHGNPATVTQKGSHYVERSEAEAKPVLTAVAEAVLTEFLGGL